MTAREPIKQGAQVYTSYGNKDNHKLLFSYGFVIPTNPIELTDLIDLVLGQDDPLYDAKKDILTWTKASKTVSADFLSSYTR